MRPANRLACYTAPVRRSRQKVPTPVPLSAGSRILLRTDAGEPVFFRDLAAKRVAPPGALPPLLPARLQTRVADEGVLARMRDLRAAAPARWPITRLAAEYGVSRSFVIGAVVSAADRARADAELLRRVDAMSLRAKLGFLERQRIFLERRTSW